MNKGLMSTRNRRSWAVYGTAASCTPAPSQTAATGLVSCPAMAHCPAVSLGGTRALTGHTKQNHPLLLHCRCFLCSCLHFLPSAPAELSTLLPGHHLSCCLCSLPPTPVLCSTPSLPCAVSDKCPWNKTEALSTRPPVKFPCW